MRYLIILLAILFIANSYVVFTVTNCSTYLKNKYLIKLLIIVGMIALQTIGLLSKQPLLLALEYKLNLNMSFVYAVSYLTLGIISCLFCYLLITDIVKFVLYLSLSSSSSLYINFVRYSVPMVLSFTLVTTILGVIEIIKGPRIDKVEVTLKNLPKNFEGFTIAQISDLHIGLTIKRPYVEKVVNITNALKPNLIVLTGDLVDRRPEYIQSDIAPLKNLMATHGKFFITGNHEYYSAEEQEWLREFKNLGVTNLVNEYVLIDDKGEQIILAGVTDYSTTKKDAENQSSPSLAISEAPKDLIKILLAHQPISYLEAKKAGFDLQLSGHTHGGQYFPFTLLIRFFHRYYKGLNDHEGMWIYINRGTGYWGPPLRLGSAPEITLLTLKKADH